MLCCILVVMCLLKFAAFVLVVVGLFGCCVLGSLLPVCFSWMGLFMCALRLLVVLCF